MGFSRQEHWSGLPFPSPKGTIERKTVKSLSCVQLFVTPWTVAYQAPQSMEFSKQDYWSGFISFSNLQYSTRIYIQYAIITYYQKESEKIDIYVCVWRRQWHPTPVLLPGEFQGQRSLVGCRLWGRTESDTSELL